MGLNSAKPKPPLARFIQSRARVLAMLSLLGLLLPLISSLMPHSPGTWMETLAWLLDLGVHWQWLYLIGLLLFGTLAALGDKRWVPILFAAPLPWLLASPSAPQATIGFNEAGQSMSVLSTNLHLDNTDARPLLALVQEKQPDVLIVLELSPNFARQLDTLTAYPYRQLVPEHSPFGMGVLSRHPLHQVQVIRDGEGIPRIQAQLNLSGQAVQLVAFHPMPPLEPRFHTQRNRTLIALTHEAHASNTPTLMAGDFNATPWSSAFHGLANQGFQRAASLEGTWPAALGVVGLPLDQILLSHHWAVETAQVLENPGSDHRALFAQLRLNSVQPSP